MNTSFDYKQAIKGAKDFKDFLATFVALNFIAGEFAFDVHLKRTAATKNIREAIEIIESGTDDVEARYFALSQINSGTMLWLSNMADRERKAIYAKYSDAFKSAQYELFNFYSTKGTEALKALGVQDDLAENRDIGEEMEKSKALLEVELQKISDEYDPVIVEADQRFLQPILDKMQSRRERYNREISDLYAKAIEDREAWQKELDDLQATYRLEYGALADEYETASKNVQVIKNAMYEKKKSKTQEMGPPAELKAKQEAIVKEKIGRASCRERV